MNATTPDDASTSAWEGHLFTADGLRLAYSARCPETPPRAALLIVHGYAEHGGRYAPLARHLVDQGYAVYTYDQRGHGRSDGRRVFVTSFSRYVDDLDRMLRLVREQSDDRPCFLFGHSMGGAVSTLLCLDQDPNVQGLILSSPALKIPDGQSLLLQRAAGLLGRLAPRLPTVTLDRTLLSRDPDVVAEAQADPLNYHGRMPARTGAELIRAMRRIQHDMDRLSLPLLVIHGTEDRLTDPAGSEALFQAAHSSDKTLGLYPGLYHETFNEPEKNQVYDEIVAWLDEHVDPDLGET